MNGGSGDKHPRVEYTNTKYQLEAVSCEGRVARKAGLGMGVHIPEKRSSNSYRMNESEEKRKKEMAS